MATQPALLRSVSRWDLIAITINCIIGAGIFGVPARAYALAGNWSVVAFGVCAIFAALIALCFAEVASRFSRTGGPYVYARESFGAVTGFEVGWLMWLARVSSFAANSNLMVSYLDQFLPAAASGPGRALCLLVLAAGNCIVLQTGIKNTVLVNQIFTAGKLIPLLLFAGIGLFAVDWNRFTPFTPPPTGSFLTSLLLLVYAFTGFEMSTVPAGESRDPRRDLPVALLAGVGITAALYIAIQVVCIGTLPGLATSQRPVSEAADQFLGPSGALLISAGVLISITGNLNVTMLAGSRLLFAMAEGDALPSFAARVHQRFRTPWVAVLCTAVPMFLLAVSGTFVYAATVSAI
ncbi:MAG: amino acid permease, partial [Bryobacteraceae bacterium]|nr:amino acid permease [Bryobacteraceae bacterium]